jgi:hypothetical protein
VGAPTSAPSAGAEIVTTGPWLSRVSRHSSVARLRRHRSPRPVAPDTFDERQPYQREPTPGNSRAAPGNRYGHRVVAAAGKVDRRGPDDRPDRRVEPRQHGWRPVDAERALDARHVAGGVGGDHPEQEAALGRDFTAGGERLAVDGDLRDDGSRVVHGDAGTDHAVEDPAFGDLEPAVEHAHDRRRRVAGDAPLERRSVAEQVGGNNGHRVGALGERDVGAERAAGECRRGPLTVTAARCGSLAVPSARRRAA